jgi:hypothetical protein
VSRSKRPNAASDVYNTHYGAGQFGNNPRVNRRTINERMYIRVLTELSVNRFKWVALPDTVDERYLEMVLFQQALAVFHRHKDNGRFLALRGSGTGRTNMYDNPTRFTVTGGSMANYTLDARECVPIWANYLRAPDSDIVYLYASRLAEIDNTIEINIKTMRHNQFIFGPENLRQSMVNVMRQMDEGQPYIFGTEGLQGMMENIQAFNLGIDKEQVTALMIAKSRMWNECMTLLGINNANQDKRERLVADEVGANDDQVMSQRGVSLNARRAACDQINKMYDLSITVGWNRYSDSFVSGITGIGA